MTSSALSGTMFFSVLTFIAGATATYATPPYAESVALISCAGSLVCLTSMAVNLAILYLTLSTRSEIYKLREALNAHKEIKIEVTCAHEKAENVKEEVAPEEEEEEEEEKKEDDEEEDTNEDEEESKEEENEDSKANLVD